MGMAILFFFTMKPWNFSLLVIARSGVTKQSHGLSNGSGIASAAFGLLAMTNGEFFKGLTMQIVRRL
jgi:hypothetical protein